MAKLSRGNIKLMGGGGIVVVGVIGFMFAGQPLLGQLGSSNADIQSAQSAQTKLTQQISDANKVKSQSSVIDGIRNQFTSKFPNTADVPGLITGIGNAAEAAGIPASNIGSYNFQAPTLASGGAGATTGAAASSSGSTPASTSAPAAAASTSGAGAASMGVSLTVTGSPSQFAQFLKNLTTMTRNFTVTTWSISGTGSTSSMSVSGTTYLYSKVQDASQLAKTGGSIGLNGSTGGTSGAAATSTPAATSSTGTN